jgi:HlyD family secretion protein
MKHRLFLIICALAVVTVSVAAYYRASGSEPESRYVTAPVSRGDIVETVEATGTLQAVTTVQVGTQVSGAIKALHADFNSVVKQGQVIAELEPSLFQAQVEQARASVAKMQADVEHSRVDVTDTQIKLARAKELWAQQLIAKTDLETADTAAQQAQAALKSSQAQLAQGQASLNQAEVNLAHTIIRAPIDGVVIARSVDVGQTVAASMQAPTLFIIANNLQQMQVNASVDESDIGRVKPGQRVTFKVDAYPEDDFTGTVSQVRLQPQTTSNVVSYITLIDVPNPDLKLKPGMTATVTMEVARADDVERVPNAALRFRAKNGTSRVWVLDNGQPRPVTVEAGITDGAVTAVTSDALQPDEPVIIGENAAASSGSSSSPLLPFGRRGNRPRQGTGGTRQGGGGR